MTRPEWLQLGSTAWVLVAANLIPLAGVLFLGWGVFEVLALYWLENVVVGFYNVLRMLMVRPGDPVLWLGKLFMAGFFTVHYGMFTAVHGLFLVGFFVAEGSGFSLSGGPPQMFFDVLAAVLDRPGALLVLASLVVSHGISFARNYLGNGEYLKTNLQELMGQPYTRVVVMHVTVLAMGFLVVLTGTHFAGLLVLIALKTGVDLHAHQREHARLAARS